MPQENTRVLLLINNSPTQLIHIQMCTFVYIQKSFLAYQKKVNKVKKEKIGIM
jgi:hypothetical protein